MYQLHHRLCSATPWTACCKTTKIKFEGLFGLLTKISTPENYPDSLYTILVILALDPYTVGLVCYAGLNLCDCYLCDNAMSQTPPSRVGSENETIHYSRGKSYQPLVELINAENAHQYSATEQESKTFQFVLYYV